MKPPVPAPVLTAEEIETIQMTVLARSRELMMGEYASIFFGTDGFDLAGIREFQSGDPANRGDWAKSTLSGFNPLAVREYVEERSMDVMLAVDSSLSTLCGVDGLTTSHIIAYVLATIGFSGVYFQDKIGAVFFDSSKYSVEPAHGGKNQVLRILELFRDGLGPEATVLDGGLARIISGELRRTSMIPIISDFLFARADDFVHDLVQLKTSNDIFLVMVDASSAFNVPLPSDGWIAVRDAETGVDGLISRQRLAVLQADIKAHQLKIIQLAEKDDLEVILVPADREKVIQSLVEFFMERKMRNRHI